MGLPQREARLVVGDNEPCSVTHASDSAIPVHGERRALHHVAIEIRQDPTAFPWQGFSRCVNMVERDALMSGVRTKEAAVEIAGMHEGNADQAAFWNGPGGRHWTRRQEAQDTLLAPIAELLFARARVEAGESVIDIGCGCGATAIDIAKRVGPTGHVLGVDISAPMLARARERAPPGAKLELVLADATAYRFPPGRADLLCSRFGVMFFAEPVLSFANMRRALRSGGRLAFVCWREPRANPWLVLPLQEAYRHVPRLPEVGPEDPGPFAFAREERVRRILGEAGFSSIALEPIDLSIDLANGRGLDAAVESALEIGPASRALEGQPAELRDAAARSIRAALAPFQQGDSVPLAAAIWIVTATNA
jgi:ubiquinone/menaquinone biosynthesis C-methylase UbiE